MTPNWFPWIFIGGIVFILLGFLGAKFKDKDYRRIQYLQDFISGSIVIAFTGVLMPDLFPKMVINEIIPLPTITSTTGDPYDDVLQVGPPRLMGSRSFSK